jgi:hypothetical protein
MGNITDIRSTPTNQPIIGWDNRITSAVATSAAAGFPAAAALTYASYEGWSPDGGNGTLTVSVNALSGYVGVYINGTGTVKLSHLVGSTTTQLGEYSGRGAFVVLFNQANVVLIDVEVVGLTGFVANVMAGPLTELQRKIFVGHRPIKFARQVDRAQGLSESGAFLGSIIRRQTNATRIDVSNLTPDYYKDQLDGFIEASTRQPHYWSYRRELTSGGSPQTLVWGSFTMVWGSAPIVVSGFVDSSDQVAWAQVQGDPEVQNQLPNGMMSAGWSIVALP